MTPVNRLAEFRTVLGSARSAESSRYPPSSRPGSPSVEGNGLLSRARRRRKRLSEEEIREQKEEREFLAEGYQIVSHLRPFVLRACRMNTNAERRTRHVTMDPFGYQHKHLSSLTQHIKLIRRAYLSTQAPPIASRAHTPQPNARARVQGEGEDDPEQRRLRALEKAKVLTDREREEVDLRCRVVLQGCRERVGVLEVREKSQSTGPKQARG